MPIYGYSCSACGHQKDVLQKMSDPALTQCPSCGAETFSRQVSAPAFQLKGTGWYVTDFRDNGKGDKKDTKPADADASGAAKEGGKSEAAASSSDTKSTGDAAKSSESKTPASTAPAPAPAASSTSKSS